MLLPLLLLKLKDMKSHAISIRRQDVANKCTILCFLILPSLMCVSFKRYVCCRHAEQSVCSITAAVGDTHGHNSIGPIERTMYPAGGQRSIASSWVEVAL